MATAAASPALECPVCDEEFTHPKLLVCNHVICYKCIVNWLEKAGPDGGCPLCRAPILDSPPQDDIAALVDALPTDLVIVAKAESQRLLNSTDLCMYCDGNVAAKAFCLQCKMKLCSSCATSHKKIPALKNHVVEDLSQLTTERLTAVRSVTCSSHGDRLVELYCSSHGLLICLLCSSTTHRQCHVQFTQEAAAEKREELKREVQSLRDSERQLQKNIKKTKDKLTNTRTQANQIFDDMQQRVEKRRHQVMDRIQAEEDKMALGDLDQLRAAITSQAGVLESLLQSAADDVLLEMERGVESRLQRLKQQMTSTDNMQEPEDVRFDERQLTQLKAAIAAVGQQSSAPCPPPQAGPHQGPPPSPHPPTPPSTPQGTTSASPKPKRTTKPEGAALASVLKVGDRIKLHPDIFCSQYTREQEGTVTAIPSERMASRGSDPSGCVDIVWDDGFKTCCYMGRYNRYELVLA